MAKKISKFEKTDEVEVVEPKVEKVKKGKFDEPRYALGTVYDKDSKTFKVVKFLFDPTTMGILSVELDKKGSQDRHYVNERLKILIVENKVFL